VFACNGILFNHESERRGKTFVTRKITVAASKIILGQQEQLYLGNLDSKRDWGYAPEYVEGMWRILQAGEPDDYVLATNETHSIREFIEETFKVLGEEIIWKGTGIDEKGILKSSGKTVVSIDPRYFRPTEVDILIGDPSKAKEKLGWEPKTRFKELVKIMVKSDFKKAKKRIE
jgi:GDPmannose 4,6-dehydratase